LRRRPTFSISFFFRRKAGALG